MTAAATIELLGKLTRIPIDNSRAEINVRKLILASKRAEKKATIAKTRDTIEAEQTGDIHHRTNEEISAIKPVLRTVDRKHFKAPRNSTGTRTLERTQGDPADHETSNLATIVFHSGIRSSVPTSHSAVQNRNASTRVARIRIRVVVPVSVLPPTGAIRPALLTTDLIDHDLTQESKGHRGVAMTMPAAATQGVIRAGIDRCIESDRNFAGLTAMRHLRIGDSGVHRRTAIVLTGMTASKTDLRSRIQASPLANTAATDQHSNDRHARMSAVTQRGHHIEMRDRSSINGVMAETTMRTAPLNVRFDRPATGLVARDLPSRETGPADLLLATISLIGDLVFPSAA